MTKIHRGAKLTILFRKPSDEAFSIEEVFSLILPHIKRSEEYRDLIDIKYLPHSGQGLLNKIRNILYVTFKLKGLIHITGEIYYTALFKRNSILTIHDIALAVEGPFLKRFIIGLIWYKIPARVCRKITVVSEYSKKVFVEYTGVSPDKLVVIPNPLNPRLKHMPLPENQLKTLLAIGTKKNKNLIRLIEACKGLPIQLNIIGKLKADQEKALIENQINYSNTHNLSYDELLENYKQCDILTFVSTYEGFGIPIIEAQAIGRPVITSNVSSIPEVAGNAAIYVDPYSVDSIQKALVDLLNNPDSVASLIKKGQENIKRFNIESISAKYRDTYKDLR